MNILVFTATLMILLAGLTYHRLQEYVSMSVEQASWNTFIQVLERCPQELQAKKVYNRVRKSQAEPKPENPDEDEGHEEEGAPINVSRMISFPVLAETTSEEQAMLFNVLTQLVRNLYADAPLIQKFTEKNSEFIPQFLQDVLDAYRKEERKKRPQRRDDLMKIKFENSEYELIWFSLLQGSYTKEKKNESCKEKLTTLAQFLTFKKATKIRVYLAAPEVLEVIFGKEKAKEVVIMRNSLYKGVKKKKDPMDKKEASTQLQETFSNTPYLPILDFTVSKTNPNDP